MADCLVRLAIAICLIALVSVSLYQFSGQPAIALVTPPIQHIR